MCSCIDIVYTKMNKQYHLGSGSGSRSSTTTTRLPTPEVLCWKQQRLRLPWPQLPPPLLKLWLSSSLMRVDFGAFGQLEDVFHQTDLQPVQWQLFYRCRSPSCGTVFQFNWDKPTLATNSLSDCLRRFCLGWDCGTLWLTAKLHLSKWPYLLSYLVLELY